MEQEERLRDFSMPSRRVMSYLRISESPSKTKLSYVCNTPSENVRKFKEFETSLRHLDFAVEQIEVIYKMLAAILLLGELKFKPAQGTANFADLDNPWLAIEIASMLKVDEKKFQWALLNYCVITQGHAQRRHQSVEEAKEARDCLANNIYTRLVDYIVNILNSKLAFGRAI